MMVDLFYDVKYLDETCSFIMWKQFYNAQTLYECGQLYCIVSCFKWPIFYEIVGMIDITDTVVIYLYECKMECQTMYNSAMNVVSYIFYDVLFYCDV